MAIAGAGRVKRMGGKARGEESETHRRGMKVGGGGFILGGEICMAPEPEDKRINPSRLAERRNVMASRGFG